MTASHQNDQLHDLQQQVQKLEELVGTLVYLCSDASSFVCGQNIVVDGGITAVV